MHVDKQAQDSQGIVNYIVMKGLRRQEKGNIEILISELVGEDKMNWKASLR